MNFEQSDLSRPKYECAPMRYDGVPEGFQVCHVPMFQAVHRTTQI